MTTATLSREIKKVNKTASKNSVPIFLELVLRLFPRPIKSKAMHKVYLKFVTLISECIIEDVFREKEKKALQEYVEIVSHFIQEYEEKEYPSGDVEQDEMLQYLMDQSNSTQKDIAKIIGSSQPDVSEILRVKRKLTSEHIEKLCHHFEVGPGVFYPKLAA